MLRFILTSLFVMGSIIPGLCAEQWIVGRPLTGDNPVNYPAASLANNDSIDRLLASYQQGMVLSYINASSLSASAGSVVCADVSGVHYFRQNTSSSTLNTANLDTGGSFSISSTYYVYANCSANATTATFSISLNSTSPSGATAYQQIGTFITDGSGNITANINGTKALQGSYNYGTSSSAFTFNVTNTKVAYGSTASMGAGGCASISNLPFSSSGSYSGMASSLGNPGSNDCGISNMTASSMSVCVIAVPAGSNVATACSWMAIGT